MSLLDDISSELGITPDQSVQAKSTQPPRYSPDQVKALPLPDLIDWEICSMVTARRQNSEDWRRLRRYEWDQCWKDMMQVPNKTNKQSWQMTTFMPLIPKTVEVITANLHGAMMGPESPVEWETRGRPDLETYIQKVNKIIGTDFEKCKFKAHWTDFLRTAVLTGTAIGYVDYVKQQEQVMVKERRKSTIIDMFAQKLGKTPQLERFVPKLQLVKDYATFQHVDSYDVYPQPYTTDFSKDNWVIWKKTITNKELIDGMNDPDPYYRLDNVSPSLLMSTGSVKATDDPEKQIRRLAFLDYNIPTHFLEPDRQHELLVYYGPIPVWFLKPELRDDPQKKYDTVPGWLWVVDGQWVVRKRISPYRDAEPPFVKGNYIRLPGQFYGIGVGQLLKGLQVEKNELRNLNIDNINIVMQKMFAVLKDKVPEDMWDRIVAEPGAIWAFKGVDDVRKALQVVEMPSMGQDIWLAQRQIDAEAQEASAAVPATLGVGGSGDDAGGKTFRGQLLNQQVATQRFMLYARMFEICGLGDAIKKFTSRIYQFKSDEEISYILGPDQGKDFELIAPEDLEKVAKLVPIGVLTMENKGVKLAQMIQFFQMAAPLEFTKKLDLLRKIWIEMGFPDPDSVLFSDQEMDQFNQFKQSMLGSGAPPPPDGNPPPPSSNGQGPLPVAGNVPGPNQGVPRPAMPQRGPGVSPIDVAGRSL